MRFSPHPSLQAANTCTAMSSPSRFTKVPARTQWHRGYREPPPPTEGATAEAQEGGTSRPIVSGDSHIQSVREANQDTRRWQRGGGGSGAWRRPGAPHQSFARWRPPPFNAPHGPPMPSYGPPVPSTPYYGVPPPFYGPSPPLAHGSPFLTYRHTPTPQNPPLPFVASRTPFDPPPSAFRPQAFRPFPPTRPADYRTWSFCRSQPPPRSERFVVLSYNILADYLAREHSSKLYTHIPQYILDWEQRKRRLLLEFQLWSPDIMCLQEVDRYHDLEKELATRGYAGIWKMRTGNAVDGCAIFWRTNRFQLKCNEAIEFNKLGLRDNVAQISVLESRIQCPVENESSFPTRSDQIKRANVVVICNIHVLYNPKRGEIKLGQFCFKRDKIAAEEKNAFVLSFNTAFSFHSNNSWNAGKQVRTLLHRAQAVSKMWGDAPVILCGDFNSTPKSPLYNFIAQQKLTLSGLMRDQVSGQYSATIFSSRLYTGPAQSRHQPPMSKGTDVNYKPQNKEESKNLSKVTPLGSDIGPLPQHSSDSQMLDRASTMPVVATNKTVEGDILSNESCSADSPRVQIYTDGHRSYNHLGEALSIVSSNDESASEILPHVNRSNESKGYDESSFQSKKLLEFVSDVENAVTSSEGSAIHKVLHGDEGQKDNHDYIGAPSSEISIHRSRGCENILDDNGMSEVSSVDVVSGADPSASEISSENVDGLLTDMTFNKEISHSATLSQTNSENQSCISACGDLPVDIKFFNQSLDEGSKVRIEDSSSLTDNEPTKLLPDVTSLSADFDSAVNLFSNRTDNHSFSGEVHNGCKDTLDVEENSDPNFFRELLGTDEVCHFADDSFSGRSSGQGHSSDSCHSSDLDPSSVEIWKESDTVAASFSYGYGNPSYNPYLWTPMEIEIASGSADCTSLEHSLKLRSVYTDVEDYAETRDSAKEPLVTSYNRHFMGTVDYIWCSKGLQTAKVLETFPKQVLQQTPGFPTKRWGSDHIALACELAFANGSFTE